MRAIKIIVAFIVILIMIVIRKKGEVENAPLPPKAIDINSLISDSNKKILQTILDNPQIGFSDSDKCIFNTTGLTKSLGIKMKLFYPCKWEDYSKNLSINNLIKQTVYRLNDSCEIGMSVDISKSSVPINKNTIAKLTSKEFLQKSTESWGRYISSMPIIVSGVSGDEVITQKNYREGCTIYMINHLFFKGHIITITYLVVSSSTSYALYQFDKYQLFFEMLLRETKFL